MDRQKQQEMRLRKVEEPTNEQQQSLLAATHENELNSARQQSRNVFLEVLNSYIL